MRTNSYARKLLVTSVVALFALSGAVTFISLQYFQFNPLPSLFFFGDDGWCPSSGGNLPGQHCFGDFGLTLQMVGTANPWVTLGVPIAYSSTGILLFGPFYLLYESFGSYAFALVTYLLASIVAGALPAWYVTKSHSPSVRVASVAGSLCLFPTISAIDRGNSIIFCVPLVLLLLLGLREANWPKSAFAVLGLALIKPQYALLLVLFFLVRKWTLGVRFGLVFLAISFGSFMVWWGSFPKNVSSWLNNLVSYQSYQTLADPWPSNVSLARPLFWVEYVGRQFFSEAREKRDFGEYLTVANSGLLSMSIMALCVAGVLYTHKSRPITWTVISLLIIASFGPSVSFSYYLVIAIPIVALVLLDAQKNPQGASFLLQTLSGKFFLIFLILALVRVPLPLAFDGGGQQLVLTTGEFIPIVLLLFLQAQIAEGFSDLNRRQLKKAL